MQILSVIPLDKRRSKVLTDEDFAFVLYKGELKAYGIEEGKELTTEIYQTIVKDVLCKRAKERTLYLLRARDRTEAEIRRKLKESFYPAEAIEYAVSFLKQYRFVDDENYSRNYIRVYGNRKSRKQLEYELKEKGIEQETIDSLLEECQISEEEQILRFLKKKGYDKTTALPKERAKIVAALARKGFSCDMVYRLMGECFDS